MQVLVIIGHQNTHKDSFCHAIAQTVVDQLRAMGHQIVYHDLYDERFDPILPHGEIEKGSVRQAVIDAHCRQLIDADALVVIHPNWWGQPPAILKGWIDRVFCQGVAYEFGPAGAVRTHLNGKKAIVFTTSNTPRDVELSLFGDPLQNLWQTCIFGFCGVTDFYRRNFESVVVSSPQQRSGWLAEVRNIVRQRLAAES